jgi:ABC-2 type transport system permease protein
MSDHLRTILWLRWRMSMNQLRRSGIASSVILGLLAVLILSSSISLFFIALIVGVLTLPKAAPDVLMYVWDGIVFTFLMLWMIGLVAELQRAEVLSLQKLLHLPVSLSGTFVINYLGSLLSLTMVILLPGMIGLTIALVAAKGVVMLLVFPLLAGFLLMVTALTYQFQGWLAALMVNQRKRRTVIVIVTMVFVLVFQLPNLLNVFFQGQMRRSNNTATQLQSELEQLDRARMAGQITMEEFNERRAQVVQAHDGRVAEQNSNDRQRAETLISRVNMILPVGWLPYGVMTCSKGNVLPAILGIVGTSVIGVLSLWRSYHTTVRLYTGQFTGRVQPRPAAAPAAPVVPADMKFMERRLPFLSDHASAIAAANLRSLSRAPEAKMLLLSPAIMIIVFGSMLLTRSINPPEAMRPMMGFAAIGMILLTTMQLIGNQFGLDRDGFRVYVLCAAPRRDILFGKNLSLAPLSLALGVIAVCIVQALYPMRITHLIATFAELVSLFLICAVIGNFTSILAPMPVAAGSLKPAHPKWVAVLIHLVFFFLFPIVFGIVMIPLGLELLLHHFGWLTAIPIYMLGAITTLAVVGIGYRFVIGFQGRLLELREQKILNVVTSRVE